MKSRATIYDVAQRAGVAISTVSRVVNGSTDVADTTRARVLQAIEWLEYRPDRTARALANQRKQTLALALPSITTPFHAELLKGVRTTLRNVDLDLLLCDLGSATPVETLLRFLRRGTVDGLLLAGMPMTDALDAELSPLQGHVVLVGYAWPGFDALVWDDYAGGRLAMEHLLHLGHRHIGFIRAQADSTLQSGRARAYAEGLHQARLAHDSALVQCGVTTKHGGFSEEAGYEAMQTILAQAPNVTAVFASSDVQAFGALLAAREAGIVVPDDLSVIGYDDVKASRYIGLSSIDQGIQNVGARAARMLLDRMHGQTLRPSATHLVRPALRARSTTAPPPTRAAP